jgi:hypothetical protein
VQIKQHYLDKMEAVAAELQKLPFDSKADERYQEAKGTRCLSVSFLRLMPVAAKQKEAETEAQKIRENLEEATKEFEKVATERTELFLKAYEHVENEIDAVYKSLTKTQKFPGARCGSPAPVLIRLAGGSAFIQMESADEPFLHGIRFTAMPPNKGVRKIEEVCTSCRQSATQRTDVCRAAFGRREDCGCFGVVVYHPQFPSRAVLCPRRSGRSSRPRERGSRVDLR